MVLYEGSEYKPGYYVNKDRILYEMMYNVSRNGTEDGYNSSSFYYETSDPRSIMKMMLDEYRRKLYPTNVRTTIFLVIVAFFGTIGNSLVIYAFSRHLKKGTTNFFILLLAVIDLINCTVIIPLTLYLNVWWQTTNDITCKLQLSMKSTIVMFSPMILVVIAIDRCLQICFVPGIQIRLRTASIVIGVLFFCAIAISIPAGLHTGTVLKIKQHSDRKASMSSYSCHTDYRYISQQHFYIYQVSQSAAFFLMLLILIVLYTIIFFFICSRQRRWNNRYKRNVARTQNSAEDGFIRAARGSCLDKASVSSLIGCPATTAIEVDRESPDSAKGGSIPEDQEEAFNSNNNPNNAGNHWPTDQEALELEPITPDEVEGADTKMPFNQGETSNNDIEICVTLNNANNNTQQARHTQDHPASKCLESGGNARENIRRIWRRLWRRRRTVEDRRHRKKKPHVKTAQTLAVVTAAFIISFLPYQLIFLQFVMKDMEESLEKNMLFYFYFINSAVNPIIYSCMNRMFRSEIKKLCRR